jgi:hypothetical protein
LSEQAAQALLGFHFSNRAAISPENVHSQRAVHSIAACTAIYLTKNSCNNTKKGPTVIPAAGPSTILGVFYLSVVWPW